MSPAAGDIAAVAADRDAVGRGLARLDPDQRIASGSFGTRRLSAS
jgi:hypothetical protein